MAITTTNLLTLVIAVAIVLLIAKFIIKASAKTIIGLLVNSIIGFIVLWVINFTGLISLPINIITSLVTGVFGLPGILVLIILKLLHII